MNTLFKAIVLSVLLLQTGLAMTDDTPAPQAIEEHPITLDELVKQLLQDSQIKVLAAKTEMIGERAVHIVKIMTAGAYIEYVKVDAATGKFLEKPKQK